MASLQDHSIGVAVESTYKTYVAPTRFYELVEESLNWEKNVVQGKGLRVGTRVARATRRVVPSAQGSGDFTLEAISKGMGLLWQAALGAGSSTLVSGSTYQQLLTLGDAPSSLTVQKGVVETGGGVQAISMLGCMVSGWEFTASQNDIARLKVSVDAGDISTAQAYAAPSYPAASTLFHWGSASVATGAYTAPAATVLGAGATPTVNVRSLKVAGQNNLVNDRFNAGGGGRKAKPLKGLVEITGEVEIELDSTTWRDLFLSDGSLSLVASFTSAALSTGNETLQLNLPSIKFDGDLPQIPGSELVVVGMKFSVLDDLVNQPIAVVHRTADTAL